MKTYSNRSNAVRAAKSAHGATWEEVVKVMLAVDGKGFNLVPLTPAPALVAPVTLAPVAPVAEVVEEVTDHGVHGYSRHGLVECPRCAIHLSNGVMDFDSLAEQHGEKKAWAMQSKMYACMGCDFEFGDDIAEPGTKAATQATGTGIKIEKERAEQNGVTRPSKGGVCDEIWSYCEAFFAANGKAPTAKEVKAEGVSKNWSGVTTTIQYYQFRKFMGIRGRQ